MLRKSGLFLLTAVLYGMCVLTLYYVQLPGIGCIPSGKIHNRRYPALLQAALHDMCLSTRYTPAGAHA